MLSFFTYASFFLETVLFGFEPASAPAVAVVFFDAVLFNLALINFFLRELPYESLKIFPFFVFLSPFPMNQFYKCERKYNKVFTDYKKMNNFLREQRIFLPDFHAICFFAIHLIAFFYAERFIERCEV